MTTFQSPRNAPELVSAFTEAIALAGPDHDAVMALASMRAAATGDRSAPAEMTWGCRSLVARLLRQVADGGHEQAAQLRGLADGIDASGRARAVNS